MQFLFLRSAILWSNFDGPKVFCLTFGVYVTFRPFYYLCRVNQKYLFPYETPWCQLIWLTPEGNMLESGTTKDLEDYEDL